MVGNFRNKKRVTLIIIFLIASIAIAALLYINVLTPKVLKPHVEEYTFELQGIDMESVDSMDIVCADTDYLYLSVHKRNNWIEGPLVDTKYILKYSLKEKSVVQRYEVPEKNYITETMVAPYKNGIIFANYDSLYECRWSLMYTDGHTSYELDHGQCKRYESVPSISVVDGTIIYIFEDKEIEYGWGIKKIENDKIKTVHEEKGSRIRGNIKSNGKQYCFTAKDPEQEYGTIVLGDVDGIMNETVLTARLYSVAITDEYIIYSLGNSYAEAKGMKKSISSSEITEISDKPMYKICGGNGKYVLFADIASAWHIMDSETNEICEIEVPEKLSQERITWAYSMADNQFMLDVADAKKHCIVRLPR